MATSKKNREQAKRQQRKNTQTRERNPAQSASITELNIQREIDYITGRARAGEARLVVLGDFVLFSTPTRDAWLVDRADNFAACVCRDGEPQPLLVLDSPTKFAIDWPANFEIDGEKFVVYDRTGRVVEILGLPSEIAAACQI